MPARPQLSLCVPPPYDMNALKEFVENITAFFQKFPLQYEVLVGTMPPSVALPANFKVIQDAGSSSRAQNLQRLFQSASGDHIMASELDLSIPLSECFKILEAFYSDRGKDIVFGDRTKKKKKNLEAGQEPFVFSGVEDFFYRVIKDKRTWNFSDPFCPVVAIRKTAFDRVQSDLQAHGWHWTPELQRAALNHQLQIQEIPLYAGSRKAQKPKTMSEILGLLHFVLFRI